MRELMINILKPFSFLPAVLIMYAIFTLSGQPGETSADLSFKVSYKIVEIKSRLAQEYKDGYQLAYEAELIHGKVRKLAHMTEYFCLAIAVSFPFYVYGLRGIPLMLVAGDHAINDMAGDDEDTWKTAFEGAGYQVECVLKGLGEYEATQQLLVDHVTDTVNK